MKVGDIEAPEPQEKGHPSVKKPTYSLVSEMLEKALERSPEEQIRSRLALPDETISSCPPKKRNETKYVS